PVKPSLPHRLAFLPAAALAAALPFFPGCSRPPEPPARFAAIRTARGEAHDITDTVEVTGEVVPIVLTEIKSEISGRVIQVHAQPGDKVQAGQILVELDRTKLESELHEAERLVEAAGISAEHMLRELHRLE